MLNTNGPRVPALDDDNECGAVCVMRIASEATALTDNLALCPPQTTHALTWD